MSPLICWYSGLNVGEGVLAAVPSPDWPLELPALFPALAWFAFIRAFQHKGPTRVQAFLADSYVLYKTYDTVDFEETRS